MYDCLQFLSIVATIIVIVQSGFGWIKIVEGQMIFQPTAPLQFLMKQSYK